MNPPIIPRLNNPRDTGYFYQFKKFDDDIPDDWGYDPNQTYQTKKQIISSSSTSSSLRISAMRYFDTNASDDSIDKSDNEEDDDEYDSDYFKTKESEEYEEFLNNNSQYNSISPFSVRCDVHEEIFGDLED